MMIVCDNCIYVDNCDSKIDIRAFDDMLPVYIPCPVGFCRRLKELHECIIFEKFCHFIGAPVDELRAL